MPRADLLALTPDDLATLANRGLVKRAQAELSGGELEYTLSENKSGTVSVLWSDDIHCLLPANVALQDAQCSCPATALCRHLLRSVLAYQQEHSQTEAPVPPPEISAEEVSPQPAETIVPTTQTPWNPGEIEDAELENIVPAATLARARREWDNGHVVETTGGPKPSAYFHSAGVNLRFLVPGDARYTHCDCAESPPCAHVPLAVWAFRETADPFKSGLVSSRKLPLEAPVALLDEIEGCLTSFSGDGVSHTQQPTVDQLTRLETACRESGLQWPADILAELREQINYYLAHNARFEPIRVAQLTGELLVRLDAIRTNTGAVPPLFVRGANEKVTEVGAARLIGLGTSARLYKGGAELHAFFQDIDSGAVVAIKRDFPDPTADATKQLLRGVATNNAPPDPFPISKLAATPITQGIGLAGIGSGQLLVRGGKRTPAGEYSPGRAPVSYNPQSYDWDKLRAPLLIEDFAALHARLRILPPPALRPRRLGEDIHVIPITAVESAHFDRADQVFRAILRDRNGESALLIHPFTSRASEGFEQLLAVCAASPSEFRFVSARFERHSGQLVAYPLALVLGDGKDRHALQPWSDRITATTPPASPAQEFALQSHPLRDFASDLTALLGETFQIGLLHSDGPLMNRWQNIARRSEALGLTTTADLLNKLAEELTRKSRVRYWEAGLGIETLLEINVHATLFGDLV